MQRTAFATPAEGDPGVLIEKIAEATETLTAAADGVIVGGVVAAAGTVDTETGIIVESPNLPMGETLPWRRC